jgi:UDP-N-acetylmuramoyl-tripeptide--D-alanyl-D-alanine ligase
MEIDQLHLLYSRSSGVSTDTRNIFPNSMFFALKGANFNGNSFAGQALEQGAMCAIVDERQTPMLPGMVLVEDVLQTLQRLARYHRDTLRTTMIGITGTNGKTTTKELIHAVLSSHFNTRATAGNLNNHIGVPLTLLSFKGDENFGVIEMGANHLGEIAELCLISDPEYGIITNVGRAHLEGFGSFENIITTKKGLYDHIAARNGTIFINSGNSILKENKVSKQVFYGTGKEDFCQGQLVEADPFVALKCQLPDGEQYIRTKLIGAYNFENILAACCIGAYFKVPGEKIRQALENYQPNNNRSEYRKTGKNELILDAYNANPSSMEKALENFAEMQKTEKIAILGDMFELGDQAGEHHAAIVAKASQLRIPAIFVGKEFCRAGNGQGSYYESVEELAEYLKQHPVTGKMLLIKGSRGIKLERLVELL